MAVQRAVRGPGIPGAGINPRLTHRSRVQTEIESSAAICLRVSNNVVVGCAMCRLLHGVESIAS